MLFASHAGRRWHFEYFFKAGVNWGETANHTGGSAVNTFDTTGSGANNKYAKIGSVVYEAKQDFSSIMTNLRTTPQVLF